MRSFRIAEALVCVVAVALIGVWLVAARLSQKLSCPPPANHPEWSVARRWNEALLGAIRRDLPNPPVHARNLFHNSVAMWDAWAAYDPMAQGYLATEKQAVGYVAAARDEAISYAAYRVLASRFAKATGADQSLSEFDAVMDALCYPVNNTTTDGTSPAAVGNRIAASVLAYAKTDGSNEGNGYKTPDYKAVNQPLVVNKSGTTMIDPNHWQPLQIEHMISQNGIPVTNGVQQAIGPHWGHVKGFALPAVMGTGSPVDPGPPPELGDPVTDQAFKDQAVEVVHLSSQLDPADGVTIDISPGAQGANTLGTNDGQGHAVNTATGQPYPSNVVLRGNFGRAIAEFWADGPESETPPGHWNVLANQVSDELDPDLRVGGIGDRVDRLQWGVKMYLALNGAAHDAAIAAWGLKGRYDGARPISMIRYLGELGQSSDPTGPSYNREGLPLVPGLIEVITKKSSAPGQRHSTLAAHLGEIAVRALVGIPADSKSEVTGVEWILAVDWIPYQLPTFVTPAFQGYISGHSTFSRAAAEVLTGLTGSEYFPGGVFGYTINQGSLKIEKAPTAVIRLEWATYYDAADQAGRSRLWGGIHVASDDLTGR
ncbi:MAG: vanadium-dependent haloperoxidase, partial [Chloroflexi bacterium]|nr:vanadium-dependent haloperoxidase [Chloroflexota bacterium]